ncbi:MAG: hypothetical protein HF962_00510 [Sulfurovum sp.]|nr:hypothetical protein [Sulfurovum sp.]
MIEIKLETVDLSRPLLNQMRSEIITTRMEQNSWGKRFTRRWAKHITDTGAVDGVETVGKYEFTLGMQSISSVDYTSQANAVASFELLLRDKLKVDTSGIWSIDGLLAHSFFAVELLYTEQNDSMTASPDVTLSNLQCSLSLEEDAGDGRRVSWWHGDSAPSDTPSSLSRLLHGQPSLVLYSDDGGSYGHGSSLRAGSSQETSLGLYGIEDRTNAAWVADQENKLDTVWADMNKYLLEMTKQQADRSSTGRTSLVVGLAQFLAWLSWRAGVLAELQSNIEIGGDRVADDIELIDHLEMQDALNEQITDPSEIEHIYYTLETNISPPTVTYNDGTEGPDKNYEWWLEDQFGDRIITDDDGKEHIIHGLRSRLKGFERYCVVRWAPAVVTSGADGETVGISRVTVRRDTLEKSGHLIYEFCRVWLDVEVDMEDPAWYEILFRLIVGAVQVYLTWISGLPNWIQTLAIADITLSTLGVDITELHLAVAVASLGYSLYSTSWTGLSGRQMFEQAFNQIDMISTVYNSYEAIQIREALEAEKVASERRHDLAQVQDEATRYLYTDAYNQYDTFYNILYRWDPPSPT